MNTAVPLILMVICLFQTTVATANVPANCLEFNLYEPDDILDGPYAEVNVKSPPDVHRFRTVIREGSEGPPDFAGHLRVVSWGCGSNCHVFAFVDKKTGNVYIAPTVAALGAAYKLDSRLFVIDPPEMLSDNGAEYYATMSFIWDESIHSLSSVPGCDGYAQPNAPMNVPGASPR